MQVTHIPKRNDPAHKTRIESIFNRTYDIITTEDKFILELTKEEMGVLALLLQEFYSTSSGILQSVIPAPRVNANNMTNKFTINMYNKLLRVLESAGYNYTDLGNADIAPRGSILHKENDDDEISL